MNLTCSQRDLEAGLNAVRAAITKSSLSVLQSVMLDATDGLVVSATNLEIGIRRQVGASIREPGKALVPHALFSSVVKAMDGDLDLKTEGNSLRLECGKQSSRFATEEIDNFPEIFLEVDKGTILDGAVLKDMIRKVGFSAATDPGRPVLEAVLIESGDSFRMVTADGYRLSIAESEAIGETFSLLVPAKAMKELSKIDDEVTLYRAQNKAVFRAEGIEIVSQLIDGQFPNYGQIVPKLHAVRVLADVDAFRSAVRTVSLFGELMHITLDGNVKLSTTSEMGDGQAEFDAEIDGERFEFNVNGKYLLEALGIMDKVEMEASTPNTPILFKDEGWTHVLMPMMGRD